MVVVITALACLLGVDATPTFAAAPFPNRPITLIVAFEAGGSTDISARLVARQLSEVLGQQVVVDNRPGAGGRLGTRRFSEAEPDGYTLLWGSGSTLTVSPVLYDDQQYVKELTPVSLGVTQPFLFAASTATGAKTLKDFIALAKAEPGKLNFASAGVGSSNHLLGEIFMAATGTELRHIPYKGGASARDAVAKNEAQLMDEVLSPLIGSIKAGQLQPLLITSDTRHPLFPNVPTAAEAGVPDLAMVGFFALLAPAKTPPDIVRTLNVAMKKALDEPSLRTALDRAGFDPAYSSPEDLQRRIEQGRARYGDIVVRRKIKIN
ncbi:ABC transporter substrate-binding protein [Rhodopseudomonas palustris]|uniref:ABC transporter substrate-binding protein n=1 Tax=Rhodopseudomonas palustris TaxID=1076 RepID=A0A0D7EXL3_RHOPL|nr:ABC transporter substrate-binding protein [Rhodopseudomonas palustris]